MKALLINGSPHGEGCTYTALSIVAEELEKNGVESEIVHVGNKDIRGCIACGRCAELGRCVFDDIVYQHQNAEGDDATSLKARIEKQHGIHTVEHAEKIGLGSRKYHIIKID